MQSLDNKLLHQLDFQDEQLVIVRTSNVVTSSHGRVDSVSFNCGTVYHLCLLIFMLKNFTDSSQVRTRRGVRVLCVCVLCVCLYVSVCVSVCV